MAALEIHGYKENRAELPPGAARQLAAVARSLKGSRCRVKVVGYASDKRKKQLKKLLSSAQSAIVASELKELGINPDQIEPAIARMSLARAAAVARELQRLGVGADQISTTSAVGGGRRVAVTVR